MINNVMKVLGLMDKLGLKQDKPEPPKPKVIPMSTKLWIESAEYPIDYYRKQIKIDDLVIKFIRTLGSSFAWIAENNMEFKFMKGKKIYDTLGTHNKLHNNQKSIYNVFKIGDEMIQLTPRLSHYTNITNGWYTSSKTITEIRLGGYYYYGGGHYDSIHPTEPKGYSNQYEAYKNFISAMSKGQRKRLMNRLHRFEKNELSVHSVLAFFYYLWFDLHFNLGDEYALAGISPYYTASEKRNREIKKLLRSKKKKK